MGVTWAGEDADVSSCVGSSRCAIGNFVGERGFPRYEAGRGEDPGYYGGSGKVREWGARLRIIRCLRLDATAFPADVQTRVGGVVRAGRVGSRAVSVAEGRRSVQAARRRV